MKRVAPFDLRLFPSRKRGPKKRRHGKVQNEITFYTGSLYATFVARSYNYLLCKSALRAKAFCATPLRLSLLPASLSPSFIPSQVREAPKVSCGGTRVVARALRERRTRNPDFSTAALPTPRTRGFR